MDQTRRHRPRAVTAVVAATWTLVLGIGPPSAGSAGGNTPTASLQPSAGMIRFGTEVVYQGALSDAASCLGGRAVELHGIGEGDLVWTTLGTAASTPDGADELNIVTTLAHRGG